MGVGTLSGWLLNENKRKATMLDTKSLVSANKKLVVVRPEPRFLGVPYFDTCPMFLKKGMKGSETSYARLGCHPLAAGSNHAGE